MHPGENRVVGPRGGGVEAHVASVRAAVRGDGVSCACQHSDGGPGTLIRAARNLVVLVALALVVVPAPAMASPDQVLRDCIRDGKLDGTYSNSELRKARDNLPSDSDEYSDCSEVIAAAIKGGSNRGSGAGSPGVGATDPAGEAAARTQDTGDLAAIASGDGDAPKVDVGGTSLAPDSSGFFNLAGAANEVPLPLMIAVLLLALFAIASGAAALRERVPALSRIPLLSKLPSMHVPFFKRRS